MVKVTEKYLFRRLSKKPQVQPKKKGETDSEYLNRITHLYLQSQFVDRIAPMTECSSVSVIYLQNNQLQTIHNMENFPKLTCLHLQGNHISKIENLNRLKHLKKLYLGSNEISVVEGLDEVESLVELHLDAQRLPGGETLYFEPRTIRNLGRCLRVLNVSRNSIADLRGLTGLTRLEDLDASENRISDVRCLPSLTNLRSLKLIGNPVAETRKYREGLILALPSLNVLDEREITPETRTFVESLAERETRSLRDEESKPMVQPLQKQTSLAPKTLSGSMLFPILKYKAPRTVSTFSANVPPQFFSQSIRTFQYGPSNVQPNLNYK